MNDLGLKTQPERITLPSKSSVSLKVFDALGREVPIPLSEELPAGKYSPAIERRRFGKRSLLLPFVRYAFGVTRSRPDKSGRAGGCLIVSC